MGTDDRSYLDALEGICAVLITAYDRCGESRGWWSCMDEHDGRCAAHWNPEEPCVCGADDLRAAFGRLTAALLVGHE